MLRHFSGASLGQLYLSTYSYVCSIESEMKSRASKHADLLSKSDVNKRADIEGKEDGSECVDGRHS